MNRPARISAALLVVLAADGAAAQPVPDRSQPSLKPWPSEPPSSPPGPTVHAPVELNKLTDLALAMELCWQASLPARAVPGMTIRVMVAFKRNGEVFGEPKFTFVTPGVPTETKAVYQRAAAAAVGRCNPMPFSEGFGNAAAGRPWVFEFIDRRSEKGI